MSANDPYAWEADLYDATTTEVSERDVPFYTALAGDAGGPVLELGCGTGRVLERRHRLLEVHFRYPNEVLRLLGAAGLVVEQVFGGFDGRPLDSGAEDLIWIARAA